MGLTMLLGAAATAQSAVSEITVTRVISAPDGRGPLSSTHMNVVRVHPGLRFAVGLRNNATARKVTVGITISGGTGTAIAIWRAVALRARSGATVRLGGLAGKIAFAERQQLTVRVTDARGGEKWSRTYPVIFALG